MKLISPIDQLGEAEPLLRAGADELYGGYVPSEWQQRFGRLASINQRTFAGAQIDSFADLQTIVRCCRERQREFALTLNAPFYTDQQLPLLIDYVGEAVSAGVSSVILADLGLMRVLRREFPHLLYHASTLSHLGNSAAIEFYRQQGIGRVVLPRHLQVAEMAEIVGKVKGLDFDAFLLVGKCPNTEGFCTFHHSSSSKIWPCEIEYCIEPVGENSPQLQQAIDKQQSWSQTDRRQGCGLCAMPGLIEAGISGFKLVGRGAPLVRKVKNLQLAKEFLKLAQQKISFLEYRNQALAAHRKHFGICCSENVCYYPEFYQST